jgi:hypothetical protein
MTAAKSATRTRPAARAHERDALRAAARKDFAPIGSFVSAAPRAQLLGVLKQLKPHLNTRLHALGHTASGGRYQVEVETGDLQRRHLIDLWLGIKGALTSAFPPHKPGAVERLEP